MWDLFGLFMASEQRKFRSSRNPLDFGFGWWVMIGCAALVVLKFIF